MNSDLKLKIVACNLVAKVAGFVSFIYGGLQSFYLAGIFSSNINVGIMGADGIAAYDDAFYHHMGILYQDVAIFKCRRFRFIGVDCQVDWFAGTFG